MGAIAVELIPKMVNPTYLLLYRLALWYFGFLNAFITPDLRVQGKVILRFYYLELMMMTYTVINVPYSGFKWV